MSRFDHAGDQVFVSEPITPEKGSFSPDAMTQGLASLPAAFTWRGRRFRIVECLDHGKVSAPEGGVEGRERYLRREVFSVRLDTGQHAKLYVLRQPPRGASAPAARRRWFLYSIEPDPPCDERESDGVARPEPSE